MTPDEKILAIFENAGTPFMGTSEVANELDYSVQGTAKRLDELAEDGRLEKKVVGNTSIYWLPSRAD